MFNRDSEHREDVRAFCDSLWQRFRPYCPDEAHFLADARANFHARTWEMILVGGLLERGFVLEKPTGDAPDIKIVGGPIATRWPVWVEATTVELGTGLDRAARIEHPIRAPSPIGSEMSSNMAMFNTQPTKTALRYTSAVGAKTRQLAAFRARGIVAPDDPYIIAINGALLHDYSSDDDDPEILKSVYPIGDCYVAYRPGSNEPPAVGYHHRGSVTKANGTAIPTTAFLNEEFRGISALLFSRTTAWNPNDAAPDFMVTIHNQGAASPLPHGFFPFGREARAIDGVITWVKHPPAP